MLWNSVFLEMCFYHEFIEKLNFLSFKCFFLWKIDPFLFFFGFFVDFKLQDCLPLRSKILNMFSTEVFCFHNGSLLFHFFFLFHDFFIFFFRDSKLTSTERGFKMNWPDWKGIESGPESGFSILAIFF